MHNLPNLRPVPGDERYADVKLPLKIPTALKNIFHASSKSSTKSDKSHSLKEGKEGSIYSDTTTSTTTRTSSNSQKPLT